MLNVYVDESLRDDRGLCIVGAVVIEDHAEAAARLDLMAILPQGAKRLHWQSDNDALRHQALTVVERHAHQVRAYLSYFDSGKRGDEARARCLEHLFGDIGGPPFAAVTLDQRTSHQDTRDRALFTQQAVRLRLPTPPTMRHDGTLTEPLLWMADAAAGAVGDHLAFQRPEFIQQIASKLSIA